MGPMASQRGPDGLQAKIADALGKGAKLLAGGNRNGNQGFFHEPTVLSEVPLDATIMNSEPFGPVALINPMPGEAAMVEADNRLPYGLAPYAWTSDPARRTRPATAFAAGLLAFKAARVTRIDRTLGRVQLT